jgi:hypothetical protein
MRFVFVLLASLTVIPLQAGTIVAVSTTNGAAEPPAHSSGNIVSDPLDINAGIGFILNPACCTSYSDFALHSHVYVGANTPDPLVALVLYRFDVPMIVSQLELIQHANGITRVEGFAGNSPGSLVSIGNVFGPLGDVTGASVFGEMQPYTFDFNNTSVSGTYFEFVVTKTSLSDGWANYRAFPLFSDTAVPEPATWLLVGLALAGIAVVRHPGHSRRSNRSRVIHAK